MRNNLLKIALIICAITYSGFVFSQPPPPPPGGGPGTPCCWPPPCICAIPLNSGIILLIGAGVCIGIMGLYKAKKQPVTTNR